jgi:hypothetical protein
MLESTLAWTFFILVIAGIVVWVQFDSRSDDNARAFRNGLDRATSGLTRQTANIRRTQPSYDEGYNFGARMLGRGDGLMDRPIYCNVFAGDDSAFQAYDRGYKDSLEDKQRAEQDELTVAA